MESELKPCPNPWCDKFNTRMIRHHVGGFWVRCKCGVCGPVSTSRAAAIAAWNTRPALAGGEATDPMSFACSWCGVLAKHPCVNTGLGRWVGEVHFDRAFRAQECDNRAALQKLATSTRGPAVCAELARAEGK